MATIIVRALDKNGDPLRGNGLANFVSDSDAIAQIISTRLQLLQGEWFENTADGTPLFQQLLGHPITSEAVALILRTRILGTPYVTEISNISVQYGRARRTFAFSALVQTQFGLVSVTNQIPSLTNS